MKLQDDMLVEMKKYRRFNGGDMVPWEGGDHLAMFSPIAEENDVIMPLRSPKHPRVFIVKEGYHTHDVGGRQTGTKSEYLTVCFHDSHGWRGRKPRKLWKD